MIRVALTVEQNWFDVPGGTARSTNRLVDAMLSGEADHVRLLGVHGWHRGAPKLALPKGLATHAMPVPGKVLVQLWGRGAPPGLDRWSDQADVVHAPAYLLPPSSKPTVVTVHDLAFVRHPEWFTAHGVRFFNRFLDRVRAAEGPVIVPSAETESDCVEAGIEATRIRQIPWGVAPSTVDIDEARAFSSGLGVQERSVLFVGTLEPRKNLKALVDALQHLPDVQLVIVGPKGWGDVEIPHATMLGERPADEVARLMAAAPLVAYPSRVEGFGLPVLEAMSHGTPVLVHEGSTPALVAGAGGLAVDTGRSTDVADAVRSVLDDQQLRDRLSSAAIARAAEFDWRDVARSTVDVYRVAAQ